MFCNRSLYVHTIQQINVVSPTSSTNNTESSIAPLGQPTAPLTYRLYTQLTTKALKAITPLSEETAS